MSVEVFKRKLGAPRVHRTPDSVVSLARDYTGTINHLETEAANLATAAARMVQMVNQAKNVAANGEREVKLGLQQQMAYLTGAMLRLHKDWAVVEHMQARGAAMKQRPGDK